MPLPGNIITSRLTGVVFPDPAKQQPYRYGRRENGHFATVPYESVSQSQIDALAWEAELAGLNYEVQLTHGKARIDIEYNYNFLTAGYPGNTTEVTDIWEIIPGKATKDLLDSRNPLVQAVQLTPNATAELNLLKSWKANGTLFSEPAAIGFYSQSAGLFTTYPFYNPPAPGTAFSSAGVQLLKALMDGVEQVEVDTFTLSHTKVVTAQYINPAQFTNLNYIYSSATLIATENIPTTVLFDFPTDTDPAPVLIPATALYQKYQYGWKKNAPSVRQTTKQKFTIQQTYDYGLWLINIVPGAVRL